MFLALRDLRFARGRFALMGTVVALIAVLGVILTGLAAGLSDAGVSGLRAMPVTHLAFQGSSEASGYFSRSTVSTDTAADWARQPGVRSAAPYGNTLAHATVTAGKQPGTQVDVALFGVPPKSFMAPTPVTGAPLGSSADGVLVSQETLDDGVRVGDTLTVDQVGTTLRVVGSVGDASFGHIGVVYAPLKLWQEVKYGLPGTPPASAYQQATAVALRLDSDMDTADIAALDRKLGTHTVAKADTYAGSPGYSAESSTMLLIRVFLYLISALVVGAFFTVWTIQRRSEIALLKALGGTTRYVLRDALAQVAVVLVGATAVGTAVGVGMGGTLGNGAPFSLRAAPVLAASLLLVLLGVVGALVAVRRITSVDPLTALGGNR